MINQTYKTLLLEPEELHLTIRLNRPEKRNALNDTLVKELKDIIRKVSGEENIRSVTITGEGSAFCSGADLEYLKQIREYGSEKNLNDSLNLAELFYDIYSCPKPTIALVNGPAIAGGCGLATVCDFVFADKNAKFGYPEVKIGFIAAMVSVFLLRQIGERKTRQLLLSGKIISASEAVEFGLINRAGEWDEVIDEHRRLIHTLQNNSAQAIKATKSMIANFTYADVENELKRMASLNADFRKTDDFNEGISAFLEKRKPKWVIS